MDYMEMKEAINEMMENNIGDFVKALISVEKGVDDKEALDKIYDAYMENDAQGLLDEQFDYMIDDLREQGLIKDTKENASSLENVEKEERNDLVNLVGNIAGNVDTVERQNRNGSTFQVSNFSIVSKNEQGEKTYRNCSAYGDKADIPKNFKQGDFVKIFGQVRTSVDDKGKEHTNVRVLSSKLLKAREQMKGQEQKKPSIMGEIKKYKNQEQAKQGENRQPAKK